MKRFLPFFILVPFISIQAQYRFEGQVSENFKNRPVYLSLVDDYRKVSRINTSQVIQNTPSDSLGFFFFEGDFLNDQNRIYRIHTDSCSDQEAEKNHLLGKCESSESILFIANNNDTLSLPVGNLGQAFCEIVSTNAASNKLLEAELLRESMVLDIVDSDSEKARMLNYEKWFKKLQDFGVLSREPLVELFCYNFLSDRSSEAHAFYQKDLQENTYYGNALSRLTAKYPDATFTNQFISELQADQSIVNAKTVDLRSSTFKPSYFLYLSLALVSLVVAILFLRRKRNSAKKNLHELSPQELRVYQAMSDGKSNKEIASELFISHSTVKTHINNIYKKLGISSRNELL
ncbi:response regulator transcription factor [Allomuricauda sp. d1]|uniref:helix-turn-helix transcriptional regulator n=1 Tax=Allomuricauda sp. d1 TaxID=3136725 RepID=UPI0031DD5509